MRVFKFLFIFMFFISGVVNAREQAIDYETFLTLSNDDKRKVVLMIRDFYVALETNGPQKIKLDAKTHKTYTQILNFVIGTAYADAFQSTIPTSEATCVWAGWISVVDLGSGLCRPPSQADDVLNNYLDRNGNLKRSASSRFSQLVNREARLNERDKRELALLRGLSGNGSAGSGIGNYLRNHTIARYNEATNRRSTPQFIRFDVDSATATLKQVRLDDDCNQGIICNPAIYGKYPNSGNASNRLFCVPGAGDALNSAVTCAQATEFLTEGNASGACGPQAEATPPATPARGRNRRPVAPVPINPHGIQCQAADAILDTTELLSSANSSEMASHLFMMYDTCMCSGARVANKNEAECRAAGTGYQWVSQGGRNQCVTTDPAANVQEPERILSPSYTNRIFADRTCYGIMRQTMRIMDRLKQNNNMACYRNFDYSPGINFESFLDIARNNICHEFNAVIANRDTPMTREQISAFATAETTGDCENNGNDIFGGLQDFLRNNQNTTRSRGRPRTAADESDNFRRLREASLTHTLARGDTCPVQRPAGVDVSCLEYEESKTKCQEGYSLCTATIQNYDNVDPQNQTWNFIGDNATYAENANIQTGRSITKNQRCIAMGNTQVAFDVGVTLPSQPSLSSMGFVPELACSMFPTQLTSVPSARDADIPSNHSRYLMSYTIDSEFPMSVAWPEGGDVDGRNPRFAIYPNDGQSFPNIDVTITLPNGSTLTCPDTTHLTRTPASDLCQGLAIEAAKVPDTEDIWGVEVLAGENLEHPMFTNPESVTFNWKVTTAFQVEGSPVHTRRFLASDSPATVNVVINTGSANQTCPLTTNLPPTPVPPPPPAAAPAPSCTVATSNPTQNGTNIEFNYVITGINFNDEPSLSGVNAVANSTPAINFNGTNYSNNGRASVVATDPKFTAILALGEVQTACPEQTIGLRSGKCAVAFELAEENKIRYTITASDYAEDVRLTYQSKIAPAEEFTDTTETGKFTRQAAGATNPYQFQINAPGYSTANCTLGEIPAAPQLELERDGGDVTAIVARCNGEVVPGDKIHWVITESGQRRSRSSESESDSAADLLGADDEESTDTEAEDESDPYRGSDDLEGETGRSITVPTSTRLQTVTASFMCNGARVSESVTIPPTPRPRDPAPASNPMFKNNPAQTIPKSPVKIFQGNR